MIERALAGLARLVVARPGRIASALAATTAVAAILIPHFRIEPDIASLFPDDHEAIELMRATDVGQRGSRTLLLTIRAREPGAELDDVLPDVIARLEASPYLTEIIATPQGFAGDAAGRAPLYSLDDASLDALQRRLTDPNDRRAALRESERLLSDPFAGSEVVTRDPLGLRWILSEAAEGRLPSAFDASSPFLRLANDDMALILVIGRDDPFDIDFSRALLADIEERLSDVDVAMLGGYATARADASRIRSDLETSMLFSVPLIFLYLAAATRSFRLPHLLVLPIGLAILWALAFGGALLGPLTPLAVSAAAILIGLGVDFTIHYTRRYRVERMAGSDHSRAIERTGVTTGRAIFAGLTTTLAAFLCFGLGSFRGLQTFGFLLAIGLGAAFVATMVLLPLLLSVIRLPERSEPESRVIGFARALARSRCGRPAAIGLVALSCAGWVLVGLRGLEFNADPSGMRPADGELARLANDLEQRLGMSHVSITVLTPAATPLDRVRSATNDVTRRGLVAFDTGAQAALPTEARRARVEEFRAATANFVETTLVELEETGFRAAPFRPGLEAQSALFAEEPSADVRELQLEWRGASYWVTSLFPTRSLSDPAHRAAFHAAVSQAFGPAARIVDPYALADELGPLLRSDLVRAAGWCAAAILLLVLVNAGSVSAGLATLVPVFCGLGLTLGALVWLGVPLHPGNFIAIPLILGLGVDDGIHLVLHYREGTGDPLGTTGTAVWRTTATTCLGFGSLLSVSTPAIAALGGIVLGGVLCCFVASVVVLPALYEKHDVAAS